MNGFRKQRSTIDAMSKIRVGGAISQSKHTDLGIPNGEMLIVTLFLVAINAILGELGNGVDGSLFAVDLTIHITRNRIGN